MRFENNIIIIGRLTRDVEIKEAGDSQVCHFSLAVNRPYQKDKESVADFIQCEAWNAQCKFLSSYFHKGDVVGLTGELRTNSYEKDGKTITQTFVRVDSVGFVPQNKKSSYSSSKENEDDSNLGYKSVPNLTLDDEEEMPF